jgi:hypothetical protein
MEVEIIPPPDLGKVSNILETSPSVVFVDYELTMVLKNGAKRSYMGGTLINLLREKTERMPLVLITKASLFRQYKDLRDQASSADLVILKSDLADSHRRIGPKVKSLVNAFDFLREIDMESRTWRKTMELLGASELDERDLLLTNAPIGSDGSHRGNFANIPEYDLDSSEELSKLEGWTAHDICSWLIRGIFRYPGVMYNSLYASAALGINHNSFLDIKEFDDSKYSGILSEFGPFWWKKRLLSQASEYLEETGIHRRVSEGTYRYLKDRKGLDVKPSVCCVSGEDFADTICYILRTPVKKKYTLPYHPDNRPSIMETARVSFKAIAETNKLERELLHKEDRRIFDRIVEGKFNDWKS